VRKPGEGGGFEFDKARHDKGAKLVLDVRIPPGGGVEDAGEGDRHPGATPVHRRLYLA
jgi:hypothetical protein